MPTWQCIENCGACCHLEPGDRPDLEDYLTPEQLEQYLGMVGPDGWCINYDKTNRKCTIYADRPRFCRVLPETFTEMFDVPADDLQQFAIDCCLEHIESIYGDTSPEMERYVAKVVNGGL
ncbi:MAG: YkgJ family cysteine cluster protein [Synechococcus sp.]|nr:YkgJ family cysteine cluster protein [Synechococcus sp.]